jgi:hypothetical protein
MGIYEREKLDKEVWKGRVTRFLRDQIPAP